jgi:phosphoserine phosphatase RsbU/P
MPTKILVVDDEPDLQLLVQQNFFKQIRKKEYDFDFALNGAEALEKLHEREFDIVLSDINMPVMDGLTLLRKIDEGFPQLRAVIISAYGDTKNVRVAMNNGAFDFVTKPIDFDDLEITIRKTLKEVELLKDSMRTRDALVAVKQELEIGQQIQSSFLPTKIPSLDGWEVATYFHPAREVAGDFYDAFEIGNGDRMSLLVADVCDKGVGAALFMALIRSLLRAFTEVSLSEDGSIHKPVSLTNEYLIQNHIEANMFATMFFTVLSKGSDVVRYINGGHNPPVVIGQDGSLKTKLNPTAPAVGMFPNVDFKVGEVTLEPGDILVAYTDGVTEAKDINDGFYTEERLFDLVQAGSMSAKTMLDRVISDVTEHIGEAKQFDDITMFTLKKL